MRRRDFIKSIGLAGAISFLPRGTSTASAKRQGFSSSSHPNDTQANPVSPFSLCCDSSDGFLVTDPSLYRVFRLAADLKVSNSFGKPGSAPSSFNYPKGIAIDENSNIYVADSNNCRIQIFEQSGNLIRTVGGVGSIGGLFAAPQGLCLNSPDRMLVADTRNHRVQVFHSFELAAVIGELGDAENQFRLPTAVQVSPDGEILVLDSKHGQVKFFDKEGNFKRSFSREGTEAGMLNAPQGMFLDSDGAILIADTGNHRVQKFDFQGKLLNLWEVDASGAPIFLTPTGVVGKMGSYYVADSGKGTVIKVSI
ncbi:MAG: NHL repeat-containing protein [Pseudomonadota bacterium]